MGNGWELTIVLVTTNTSQMTNLKSTLYECYTKLLGFVFKRMHSSNS